MKKLALLALLVASNFAYAQHKKITFGLTVFAECARSALRPP